MTTDTGRKTMTTAPTVGSRGRTAREFWQIPAAGWRDIAKRTWSETGEDDISLLAAGVAFYSFLAFVPMLAAIVLIYGLFTTPGEVASQVHLLVRILPADAATIIANQMKSLTATPVARTTIGLIVAIVFAVYGAMRGATSVIGALNITYGERESRSFLRTTGLSAAFTVGAILVAIVAMASVGALSLVGKVIHLPGFAAPLVTGGLWLFTALIASVLVAVVYRYGPDRQDARWTWLTPGAVFASVAALLATFLFGFYVSHFAGYNATYGTLGAVVSFLMWLYVSAFVVLLGAELNAEIERQTAQDTTTGPAATIGDRGARAADTAAGAGAVPIDDEHGGHDRSSALAPIAAGVLASRVSRYTGGVRVGVVPMTLIAGGTALLGQRGRMGRGLLFVAVGLGLAVRTGMAGGTAATDRAAGTRRARVA